jgi:hypothetical protein
MIFRSEAKQLIGYELIKALNNFKQSDGSSFIFLESTEQIKQIIGEENSWDAFRGQSKS